MNTSYRPLNPRHLKPALVATPSELKAKFLVLATRRDVANILEVPYALLVYHLFKTNPDTRYRSFDLAKRRGGTRTISAPSGGLKILQRKLNQILQLVYTPPHSAHGFVLERSIASNAVRHVRHGFVLNVDIEDFFGAINFGRVRGLFLRPPYSLTTEVATTLAQLCCHKNALPQGAPTSPVVSNLICIRLDHALGHLARENNLEYSRYADDITFSTERNTFPRGIAFLTSETGGKSATVGGRLRHLIESNGFRINDRKVKLQSSIYRQEVTGLVVNRKRNVKREFVRQIRAMLHAINKFGEPAASAEFANKYDKRRTLKPRQPSLIHVVAGKIHFLAMVRGNDDPLYQKYRAKLPRGPVAPPTRP